MARSNGSSVSPSAIFFDISSVALAPIGNEMTTPWVFVERFSSAQLYPME